MAKSDTPPFSRLQACQDCFFTPTASHETTAAHGRASQNRGMYLRHLQQTWCALCWVAEAQSGALGQADSHNRPKQIKVGVVGWLRLQQKSRQNSSCVIDSNETAG